MNIYALAIGTIVATFIILQFKRKSLEKARLPYPILLASFPLYYFAFVVYASDYHALYKEIGFSLIFFSIAYFAIKSRRRISMLLVGIGCIVHGIYDIFHDYIFINNGTPVWWIEFCGSVDLILGSYLLYLFFTISLEADSKNN